MIIYRGWIFCNKKKHILIFNDHRFADLVRKVNDTYSNTQLKSALKEVIDAYTFFDDAYDKIHEWSGPEAKLQNTIINNYTNEIPFLMREVSF